MAFGSKEGSRLEDGIDKHALNGRLLSSLTAAILFLLLVAFFAVTMVSMNTISQRVDELNERPYPVTIASGKVETYLVQLGTLAERLTYTRTEGAIARVEAEYRDIDLRIANPLDVIVEKHASDPEGAVALRLQYDQLVREQQLLIAQCRNAATTDEDVANTVHVRIEPLVADMVASNKAIVESSRQSFTSLYDLADQASSRTILYAGVSLVVVMAALVVFLFIIRRKDTHQRHLQQSLEVALTEARHANQAKSQFLAGVSHDIRTPCSAIVGLTEIAERHVTEPDRVNACLEKIELSSHHLLSLINDVLDMSKIESGQIMLSEEPFALSELLAEVGTIVQSQAKTKQLTFEIDVESLGNPCLCGDALRLKQVLLNLLSNAVKYTEPGGFVKLQAKRIERTDLATAVNDGEILQDASSSSPDAKDSAKKAIAKAENTATFCFEVSDNGIGMTQEFLGRIFDPFERELTEDTRAIEGTGLGMSIVKNILTEMDGTISVASACRQGTTFTVVVSLPYADEGTCRIGKQPDADIPTYSYYAGVRVLLAEDDEINAEIACDIIGRTQAEVHWVHDGEAAVAAVLDSPESHYDIVFMDLQMPRMGGLAAARTLHEAGLSEQRVIPPIVAMTANAYVEDRQRAYEVGMVDYLVKPFGHKDVCRVLAKHVYRMPSDHSSDVSSSEQ